MLLSSYSARTVAPFQRGPQDATHPTFEIVWVTSGRIAATVGGAPQCLDAEHFSVIAPGVPHSSWTLDDEVTSHVLHLFASPQVALASGVYPREGEVARVLRAFPPPTAPRDELERAARALIDATRALATPLGGSADDRVLGVARTIARDPTAPITLDELARRAHMSRHHFARAFRRQVGFAPMAYVRRLRAERAAMLLRATDRSIAEIAFACGFSSAGRLSEAFRARFATSPTAWRAQHRDPREVAREEQPAERARQSP